MTSPRQELFLRVILCVLCCSAWNWSFISMLVSPLDWLPLVSEHFSSVYSNASYLEFNFSSSIRIQLLHIYWISYFCFDLLLYKSKQGQKWQSEETLWIMPFACSCWSGTKIIVHSGLEQEKKTPKTQDWPLPRLLLPVTLKSVPLGILPDSYKKLHSFWNRQHLELRAIPCEKVQCS